MIKPHDDSLIFIFFTISLRIACFNYVCAYKTNTLLQIEDDSDVNNSKAEKKEKKEEENKDVEAIHPPKIKESFNLIANKIIGSAKIKESLSIIGDSLIDDKYINFLYDVFENVVNKEMIKI